MQESVEKLRKLRDEVEAHDVDNPIWVCSKATIIADEIERAIAERYMPLPVGADGALIHVGDTLECDANGYKGTFTVFAVGDNIVVGNHDIEWIRDNPSKWFHIASFCCHVKPRTVEDVLREYGDAVDRLGQANVDMASYAAELQMRDDE